MSTDIHDEIRDKRKERALELLHEFLDNDKAEFHEGQLEAIMSVMENKASLVIQKTGWGKSVVYFIAARMLKEENEKLGKPGGITIVISPLVSLIKNQVKAVGDFFGAEGAKDVRSKRKNDPDNGKTDIKDWLIMGNKGDIIFTTEHGFNTILKEMENSKVDINLVVIDEAHCISQWGGDFRFKYAKILDHIENLENKTDSKIKILGTTATLDEEARGDLIESMKKKSDDEYKVEVIRGKLFREELIINKISDMSNSWVKNKWLREFVPSMVCRTDSSEECTKSIGIIYCATILDCYKVKYFLNSQEEFKDISIETYSNDLVPEGQKKLQTYIKELTGQEKDLKEIEEETENDDEKSKEILQKFDKGEIHILIATTKLGMGYDKKDISFIIHYNQPQSIVEYYQQIGRAGRNGQEANIYYLYGQNEDGVSRFFIKGNLPSRDEYLEEYKEIWSSGSSKKVTNINTVKGKCQHLLEKHGYIIVEGTKNENNSSNKDEKVKINSSKQMSYGEMIRVMEKKYNNRKQVNSIFTSKQCYFKTILNALGDDTEEDCGKCTYCTSQEKGESNEQ